MSALTNNPTRLTIGQSLQFETVQARNELSSILEKGKIKLSIVAEQENNGNYDVDIFLLVPSFKFIAKHLKLS